MQTVILAETSVIGHGIPFFVGIASVFPVYLALGLFMFGKRRLAILFLHLACITFIFRVMGASFGLVLPLEQIPGFGYMFWYGPVFSLIVYGYIVGMSGIILFHVAMIYGPSRNAMNHWWAGETSSRGRSIENRDSDAQPAQED